MSISSLSLSFANRAASTPAAPADARRAPAPATLPVADDHHEKHGGARPKALYNAMLSALNDLGMTAAPPAPPAPGSTAASTDAAPSAAATPSVKGAVSEFASALFQALRGAGESVGGEEHHSNHGRGHAYAYGRTAHAWSHDGYAGLADRLEGLAASLTSPVTPATPAASPTPPTADPTAPTASTGPAPQSAPIDASGSNPLVSAFNSLLQALHVPVVDDPSGSDVTARLASFLHSLAQALQPAPTQAVAPAPGMLLSEMA